MLKNFGIVLPLGAKRLFAVRDNEVLENDAKLGVIVGPLLEAWHALREQSALIERRVLMRAKDDPIARRLMTVPGVGPLVSLAYMATIDDPKRFSSSADVGAYLGLTPRRWQSGAVNYQGHISRSGDAFLRGYLFEAATVLLQRCPRSSALKEWGLRIAARSSMRKAKVAVARKLAVILHRIWVSENEFNAAPAAA